MNNDDKEEDALKRENIALSRQSCHYKKRSRGIFTACFVSGVVVFANSQGQTC